MSNNIAERKAIYEAWLERGRRDYDIIQTLIEGSPSALITDIPTKLRREGRTSQEVTTISGLIGRLQSGLATEGRIATIVEIQALPFELFTTGHNAYATDREYLGPSAAGYIEGGIRRRPEKTSQT